MFLYDVAHPDVSEVTGMTRTHSYTTVRQVVLVLELDTVAPQTDPQSAFRGQSSGEG